jgi:hypothetical protein
MYCSFIGAFSWDSVPGGGGQPLKHCGGSSLSGTWHCFARLDAKQGTVGERLLYARLQIDTPAAGHAQPSWPLTRVLLAPLG